MENFLKEPVNLEIFALKTLLTLNWLKIDFKFSKIFDMLHATNPVVLQKIIPIEVDYDAYDLNLDPEALERIHTEVQVALIPFLSKNLSQLWPFVTHR